MRIERAQRESSRRNANRTGAMRIERAQCESSRRNANRTGAMRIERAQCESSRRNANVQTKIIGMKTKELRYTPSHLSSFLFKNLKQAGMYIYLHPDLFFTTGIDSSKQIIDLPLSGSNGPDVSIPALNVPPISSANDFATVNPKPVPP